MNRQRFLLETMTDEKQHEIRAVACYYCRLTMFSVDRMDGFLGNPYTPYYVCKGYDHGKRKSAHGWGYCEDCGCKVTYIETEGRWEHHNYEEQCPSDHVPKPPCAT